MDDLRHGWGERWSASLDDDAVPCAGMARPPHGAAQWAAFPLASPMIYNALKLAHVLSIIVWIGGMVFAHFSCAPPRGVEPAQRVTLMHGVLQRFLGAVAIAIVVVLTSGLGMIGAPLWVRAVHSPCPQVDHRLYAGPGDDGHLRLHLLRPAR